MFSKAATSPRELDGVDNRDLHFTFFRKPDRFFPSELSSRVGGVLLEKTCLKGLMALHIVATV